MLKDGLHHEPHQQQGPQAGTRQARVRELLVRHPHWKVGNYPMCCNAQVGNDKIRLSSGSHGITTSVPSFVQAAIQGRLRNFMGDADPSCGFLCAGRATEATTNAPGGHPMRALGQRQQDLCLLIPSPSSGVTGAEGNARAG